MQTPDGHAKAAQEPLDQGLKLRRWDNTHKTVVERSQVTAMLAAIRDGQVHTLDDYDAAVLRGLLDGTAAVRTELTERQREIVDVEFGLNAGGEGTPLSWKLYALAGVWGVPVEAISAYVAERAAAERERKQSGGGVDIRGF